jgi:hypothetical protein
MIYKELQRLKPIFTNRIFRLPRPAEAGLAMTPLLLSANNYQLPVKCIIMFMIIKDLQGLQGKDEGGRMKDEHSGGLHC